jgi:SAM-dependent methyltransferase
MRRLGLFGLASDLAVADAELLPFDDDSFDLVYSWGVLHHSPDTRRAIDEAFRVLRPGGKAKIMIYHSRSIVGYLLWLRYALLAGRPGRSLSDIYAHHLESPGTQAFTVPEATALTSRFAQVNITVRLAFGDLLEGEVGQQHQGVPLAILKQLWPRWLIKRLMPGHGLCLLIEAVK